MERREFVALLGIAATLMPCPAGAGSPHPSDSYATRILGTWAFSSSINMRWDGSTFDRWGGSAKGIFMFDGGHYAQIIVGSESRVFGSKVFCAFGSYAIDEAHKTLVTNVEACSVSRLNGSTQTRNILALTADELKYSNPSTSMGASAEVLWKRLT